METELAVGTTPSGEYAPIGERPVFSRSRHLIAYDLLRPPESIIVRTVPDLQVKQVIQHPATHRFNRLTLSPDGQFLVVDVFKAGTGRDSNDREVLVYATESGNLLRRFKINAGNGLAVSPDNRLLVAGQLRRKQERGGIVQAVAVVYGLESGRELGSVAHPAVKEPRKNPFIAYFHKIIFSPDGRFLVTSTQDTRVWRVEVE